MFELMYDVQEFCKTVNIKNFKEYAGFWLTMIQRQKIRNKLYSKEGAELLNERIDIKIRYFIKLKKRAEKILEEFSTER